MPMKNHPHPGRIVRQDFLEPLGLTVTEAARVLGVARQTINNLVNEKAGISGRNGCAPVKGVRTEPRDVGSPSGQLRPIPGAARRNLRQALQASLIDPSPLSLLVPQRRHRLQPRRPPRRYRQARIAAAVSSRTTPNRHGIGDRHLKDLAARISGQQEASQPARRPDPSRPVWPPIASIRPARRSAPRPTPCGLRSRGCARHAVRSTLKMPTAASASPSPPKKLNSAMLKRGCTVSKPRTSSSVIGPAQGLVLIDLAHLLRARRSAEASGSPCVRTASVRPGGATTVYGKKTGGAGGFCKPSFLVSPGCRPR